MFSASFVIALVAATIAQIAGGGSQAQETPRPKAALVSVEVLSTDGTTRKERGIVRPDGLVIVSYDSVRHATSVVVKCVGERAQSDGVVCCDRSAGVVLLGVRWAAKAPAVIQIRKALDGVSASCATVVGAGVATVVGKPGPETYLVECAELRRSLETRQINRLSGMRSKTPVPEEMERLRNERWALGDEKFAIDESEKAIGAPVLDAETSVTGIVAGAMVNKELPLPTQPSEVHLPKLIVIRPEVLNALSAGPLVSWADWPARVGQIDLANALIDRADALWSKGAVSDAVDAAKEAVRLDPRCQRGWLRLGLASGREQEWAGSIENFSRALLVVPSDSLAEASRALALGHVDRAAEALEGADRAIRIDADSAYCHQIRGWVLVLLHRDSEAIRSYGESLRLDPANASVKAALEELRQRIEAPRK
jgi:cytochrome c-type biogenesis protein CcmH/NrfG